MRIWNEMNRTVRGLLIVALVALVVVVLQLQQTLSALSILAQLGFLLAIAFFVYLVWRERRSEIGGWPTRVMAVFYGAAVLIVLDIGYLIYGRPSGLDALVFFVVLAVGVYALVRIRRDQHRYV